MTTQITEALRKSVARDLRWAVDSPLLFGEATCEYRAMQRESEIVWQRLAATPSLVPNSLVEARRVPIGRYFETLLGFWLSELPQVSRVVRNLVIQGANATLGEMDLLFDYDGRSHHWEVAIKFYLGVGALRKPENWWGPGARDRLDLKVDKLYGKQLLLPRNAEASEQLHKLGYRKIQSASLLKGYFFAPFDAWRSNDWQVPSGAGQRHGTGWWIRLADISALQDLPGVSWQHLEKVQWLGPSSGSRTEMIEGSRLADWVVEKLAGDKRPPMLAAVSDDGVELHRGFVVSDDWLAGSL